MAPVTRAAIRFVAAILLVSSLVNAVALPHQVLDPRTPLVQENVVLPDAADAGDDTPKNFWGAIGKLLNNNSGWDIFRDFWARLFGGRNEDNDDGDNNEGSEEEAVTTVFVTPTPVPEASSSDVVIPPGPPETTSIELPAGTETIIFGGVTPTPTSEEGIFSILPFGDVSTAINISLGGPVEFSTITEIPPTASDTEEPAPAVPITDEFSVTIPVELLTTAIPVPAPTGNYSAPEGTGVPAPAPENVTAIVIEPSVVIIPIEPTPLSNETSLNTTSISETLTSLIVVTATVTPEESSVPLVTGAAPSVGTGLPIAVSEAPVWINSTGVPAVPVLPVGTGTGVVPVIPIGTGTSVPVIPVIPIIPIIPLPGTAVPIVPILPIGTGIPVVPIIPIGTGTGGYGPPVATAIPVPEVPLFPNTTSAAEVPEPTEVQLPLTVTGTPGETLNLTVSIPTEPVAEAVSTTAAPSVGTGVPIPISEIPIFTNTSSEAEALPTPTVILGTGSALPSVGTGLPAAVSVVPIFPNVTAEIVVIVTPIPGTAPILPSVGTELPAPISEAPIFVNNTVTKTESTTETATAVVILPPPVETTDVATEFPGLLALRAICQDPQINVITLPLLDRFYGPNAYPALYSFPGCTAPNARQAVQAPGLLDCSALGKEVQTCQANGRKVLLSVKADSLSAVGGNTKFGDPESSTKPFGPAFAAGGLEKEKRQEGNEPYVIVEGPLPLERPQSSPPLIVNGTVPAPSTQEPDSDLPSFPNLFDLDHPPSALALTLFSLFGEGHTERADLRPLGPLPPGGASPESLNGTDWINPILTALQRPLGEEVVLDGFDVQLPAEWKGTYQDGQFRALVTRLKELHSEAWGKSGGVVGGKDDLGADGKGVVFFGWVGGALKVRSATLQVRATMRRPGWKEWDGGLNL